MIETLIAAFAFGTFWFWLFAVIASVIIIACVENEHYATPSIVAIIIGIVYWKQIAAAPWSVIALVAGGYAVGGAIWSAFQWFRRTARTADKYRQEYGDSLTSTQMGYLKNDVMASRHKALITGWIAFWPWNLFWTLTGDFFNTIYDAMANVYQKISDSATGKFTVQVPEPKKEVVTDAPIHRRY